MNEFARAKNQIDAKHAKEKSDAESRAAGHNEKLAALNVELDGIIEELGAVATEASEASLFATEIVRNDPSEPGVIVRFSPNGGPEFPTIQLEIVRLGWWVARTPMSDQTYKVLNKN